MNIDSDIEDADATGGNGAKTYSFTYTTIDYYGAGYTEPFGINDSGQIVGSYVASGVIHGFLYAGGSLINIDFPNATQTFPYGINNAGDIAGLYVDQQGQQHGFLYQGAIYISLDYPGAKVTWVVGINDDDQVSGYYTDSQSVNHGFQYQAVAATFTSFDYPLVYDGTEAFGINGDAQIAGGCPNADCPAFLYAQGTFSYPPVEGADGLNNNDQITGSIGGKPVFEHEGSSIVVACPNASSTNPVYSPSDFILNSQTTAKVALVGTCVINGVVHGFLATSQ